jgi:glyoxylase-like metal-dependent hydrolase (beta-lactamase superfamily II)/ferredoxin
VNDQKTRVATFLIDFDRPGEVSTILTVDTARFEMARGEKRHPESVPGEWFIDDRCIGCGGSTSIAPDLIRPTSEGRQFAFIRQPSSDYEVRLAEMAAEVCPARSIGTESRRRWLPHHPVVVADGVWRTGSNSPTTAGGNAYLVPRDVGNLLIDAPRHTARLHGQIAARGGLAHVLLTHRDDVGDAQRYAEAFRSEVVIHEADREAAPFAGRLLVGREPVEVAAGVPAIPTPGHTAGHVMFLIDGENLFTGDSLSWDPFRQDLWAEKFVCWDSWPNQLESLARLADHRFARVIPSHGVVSPRLDPDDMADRLRRLVSTLRASAAAGAS